MNFKNVKELTSQYTHGCRLDRHNHIRIWPLVGLRTPDEKAEQVFALETHWTFVGWCIAPYGSLRGYNDALVLEYTGDDDEWRDGYWWMHCDLDEMNFEVL